MRMDKYTTERRRLQEAVITQSGKKAKVYVDTATGELVTPLRDDKSPWRDKKRKNISVAELYKGSKYGDYADKAFSCSTWLQFYAKLDGSAKQLRAFNGCHLRLCPLCSARRARIMAARLAKVLARAQADHKGTQLLFLTLTVENCEGDKLRETLDALAAAWVKLIRRRPFVRAVKGWFRAVEITRNREEDTYHPHIHAILMVENAYFYRDSPLYITHDDITAEADGETVGETVVVKKGWVTMWRESLQVGYDPVVDIRATYKGQRGGKDKRAMKAAAEAKEAAKYATKDSDFLDPSLPAAEARRVLEVYTGAIARKRLTAMGGWVREAAQQLALDVENVTDLVHGEDEAGELSPKEMELLENYGWNFGVGEHVLTARMPNPEYDGPTVGVGEIPPPPIVAGVVVQRSGCHSRKLKGKGGSG